MPIDTSIYQNQTQVDPFGSIERGMRLGDLLKENKKKKQIDEAYKSGLTTNPDGTVSFDQNRTLGALAGVGGKEYFEGKNQIQQQQKADLQNKLEGLNVSSQLLGSANDQNTWTAAKQKAQSLGLDVSQAPDQFNPEIKKQMLYQTASGLDQIKQQIAQQEANAKSTAANADMLKASTAINPKEEKTNAALIDHLQKGWTGRSGAAGKVQQKLNDAEYAQGLIDQGKAQEGGLDSRQVEELAQSTARLLGGGGAASARVEALVPHTLFGRTQTLKEWLSNNPQGAEMQAFTDRMAETVKREGAIAEKQKRSYQIEGLGRFENVKKKNPDFYQSELNRAGITPNMIDKNGRYAVPPETKNINGVDYIKVEGGWLPK